MVPAENDLLLRNRLSFSSEPSVGSHCTLVSGTDPLYWLPMSPRPWHPFPHLPHKIPHRDAPFPGSFYHAALTCLSLQSTLFHIFTLLLCLLTSLLPLLLTLSNYRLKALWSRDLSYFNSLGTLMARYKCLIISFLLICICFINTYLMGIDLQATS